METKPASKRQLAYIRRLQTVVGETEPEISDEMSVSEASAIISELISPTGFTATLPPYKWSAANA